MQRCPLPPCHARSVLDSSYVRCRAIVDLGALRANFEHLKLRAGQGAVLACVVKADAYGHGARPVATALAQFGGRHFAVATLSEAVDLRDAGIEGLILVLGGIERRGEREASAQRIEPLVGTLGQLRRWNAEGQRLGRRLPCHICLNTGMNRLGIDFDPSREASARALLASLAECDWIEPCGVATHHAAAEDFESGQAEDQERVFADQLAALGNAGYVPQYVHSANSAALVYRGLPVASANRGVPMARAGLALYGYVKPPVGLPPSASHPLRRVLEWRARVTAVRTVAKGARLGYGATFVAPKQMRIGVLSVGYGDGLDWRLSNRGAVSVRGSRCPIVGQVSMDLTTVDVTDAPDAREGDEALLMGPAPYDAMGMAEVAGSIPYEVLCRISGRVQREYVEAVTDR